MSSGYKLYDYDPSEAAAICFAIAFAVATLFHLYRMIRTRTWYFTSFVIGGLFEVVGYAARAYNATQTPNWGVGPYVMQSLLLLLAPALLSASIYMILGRIIRLVNGGSRSLIRPSWLTKIFVTGDVLSFFIQSGGGGMLAQAKSQNTINMGNHIIVLGLIVQLLFFGFFMIVSMIFHRRITASPTDLSLTIDAPWSRYMGVLYTASVLIMVRSVYRVVEYVQGTTGTLQEHEAYLQIIAGGKAYKKMQADLEMLQDPRQNQPYQRDY
ncbi:hypothetical protein UA08_06353 [Talaromyces atroroseus]|uniref:Protein RTA1 n=1 Tax=Talaromyces atroroseus TaxID=1441469 RepID=A0A225AU62_TALAT|nr:hypothetical protein UA08_06353 [Talaromyces atroroseus]OKL58476.1 hypothetical protein UA08_06353 [Talaromyces atroroseus]